jgi:4-diphosphocytidyl-2-C-methyl-D-erythritol kinase
MIELKSFAKINLGLEITGRRADGYHELRTIFQTINWFDTVRIKENRSGKLQLGGSRGSVAWDDTNTVAKAYRLIRENYADAANRGFDIFIEKRVPAGSGLGGGSSNAAAVLLFLNEYLRLQIPFGDLVNMAGAVGADVPFFLVGGTVLAEGIGDKMTRLDDLPERFLGIVIPDIEVSTRHIFSRFGLTSASIDSKITKFLESLKFDILENDLEAVTFGLFPEIKEIKKKMLDYGCECALMSGSGGAVYCLFQEENIRDLEKLFPRVIVTKTIGRKYYRNNIGAWPSGKASAFGADIGGSNPPAPAR